MFNWKSLGFGLALAVVIYFMLISYKLEYLIILSFVIAPFIGGYIVGNNAKDGAIHGAIIGFFGSIIATLLFVALASYFSNTQISLTGVIIAILIMRFIIFGVIGAVMGSIGAVVKSKMEKQ